MVAEEDRLLDVLEADADVDQAGDREGAGDRASGHHDVVVLEVEGVAVERLDRRLLLGVVDVGDLARDDAAVTQDRAQRDDDVARLERAGSSLREEGLVGHVGVRLDHSDGRLTLTKLELLLQTQCGVEADVASADHQDPCGLFGHDHASLYPLILPRAQSG